MVERRGRRRTSRVEPRTDEDDELPSRRTRPSPPSEEDEDVLEETPEFLREQPEDDELWFEQGEPKDFDF